jgi:predicted DCC family thiol-disulfide oxidoreductase YuxK
LSSSGKQKTPARDRPVLVFDGECGFCTTSAGWVARRWREGAATAVASQMLGADGLGELHLSEDQAAESVWWVEPNGGTVGAEVAVGRALAACRKPWGWLGSLLLTPAGRRLGEPVYRFVAHHRHRLPGGSPACRDPLGSDQDAG